MKFKHMLVPALLALSAHTLAEPAPTIKVETSNQSTLPEHAMSRSWSPRWMIVSKLKR